jgi:hypothetical protein
MSDQQTCGKGLAHHSALPRLFGAVAAAMADVLEHHRTSLDLGDPQSRPELDAYTTLTNEFRDLAAALETTAERMAGYRDLPMAPHDEAALSSGDAVAKFAGLVRAERELLQLLQGYTRQNDAMLDSMRSTDRF